MYTCRAYTHSHTHINSHTYIHTITWPVPASAFVQIPLRPHPPPRPCTRSWHPCRIWWSDSSPQGTDLRPVVGRCLCAHALGPFAGECRRRPHCSQSAVCLPRYRRQLCSSVCLALHMKQLETTQHGMRGHDSTQRGTLYSVLSNPFIFSMRPDATACWWEAADYLTGALCTACPVPKICRAAGFQGVRTRRLPSALASADRAADTRPLRGSRGFRWLRRCRGKARR